MPVSDWHDSNPHAAAFQPVPFLSKALDRIETGAGIPVIPAGALLQTKKGTGSSDKEKKGFAHRRRGDGR